MSAAWRLVQAADTQALGAALARSCIWQEQQPTVVFLRGELGSGKTTLAAALLQCLGVTEPVRSPSYALIEGYALPFGRALHIDLYRLGDAEELELLGLRDELRGRTLLLIEWPERAERALPAPDLDIELQVLAPGRRCTLRAGSAAGRQWLQDLERPSSIQI